MNKILFFCLLSMNICLSAMDAMGDQATRFPMDHPDVIEGQVRIVDFYYASDAGPILEIIKENRKVLIPNESINAEKLLQKRSLCPEDDSSNEELILKVARDSKKVLGFIAYTRVDDKQKSYLIMVAVKAQYRQNKIGTELVKFVFRDVYKSGANLRTFVSKNNESILHKFAQEKNGLRLDNIEVFKKNRNSSEQDGVWVELEIESVGT